MFSGLSSAVAIIIMSKVGGQVFTASATVAAVLTLLGAYTYYRKRKVNFPTNWTPVAKVKQILVYPLKSGKRREVQSAQCTEYGISVNENNVTLRDRSFIVYGEANNEFKTARTFPKLVLIETLVRNNGEMVFTAPEQDDLFVRVPDSKKSIIVTLHGKEPCEAIDCGDEAALWLSRFILDKPSGLRLGYHTAEYRRNIVKQHPKYYSIYPNLRNNSTGLFQDLTSYHLISQSSINALNSDLNEKISANNFRPNILVDGDGLKPYSEENWEWIMIGDVVFRNVKPCTRCVFTTIHPDEGIYSKTREPLKSLERTNTLKDPSHIKCEGKLPVMGIHLGLWRGGQINIGDEVYVA